MWFRFSTFGVVIIFNEGYWNLRWVGLVWAGSSCLDFYNSPLWFYVVSLPFQKHFILSLIHLFHPCVLCSSPRMILGESVTGWDSSRVRLCHYLHRVWFPWFWPHDIRSRMSHDLFGCRTVCSVIAWLWVSFITAWLCHAVCGQSSPSPFDWARHVPSLIPFPITHSSILSVLSFILRTPSLSCSSRILFPATL